MNQNKEWFTIVGLDKICRNDLNECYTILTTDQICSNETGQSTFFCKNFALSDKSC